MDLCTSSIGLHARNVSSPTLFGINRLVGVDGGLRMTEINSSMLLWYIIGDASCGLFKDFETVACWESQANTKWNLFTIFFILLTENRSISDGNTLNPLTDLFTAMTFGLDVTDLTLLFRDLSGIFNPGYITTPEILNFCTSRLLVESRVFLNVDVRPQLVSQAPANGMTIKTLSDVFQMEKIKMKITFSVNGWISPMSQSEQFSICSSLMKLGQILQAVYSLTSSFRNRDRFSMVNSEYLPNEDVCK